MAPPPWASSKAQPQKDSAPPVPAAIASPQTAKQAQVASNLQNQVPVQRPSSTVPFKPAQQSQHQPAVLADPNDPNQPSLKPMNQGACCPQVIPRSALQKEGASPSPNGAPSLAELKSKAGKKKWTEQALRATDALIPLQNGTNRWFSQRGMTGFGTPRDVHGKHVHRLVDDEYPGAAGGDQFDAGRFLQDKSDI